MDFVKEYLDAVLVTTGLLIISFTTSSSSHMYIHHHLNTSIGYENKDKGTWVSKNFEVATTALASICLTLCSVIGVWISSSTNKFFALEMVYGNTSESIMSIKYLCLLSCFVLAFSFFVQAARHFVHSNYLLSTPGATTEEDVEKVERAVQSGSNQKNG
ncbi:hypothetical protein M0R45_013292 [Rubus argutus]|uniref:Uncharacterized protein n=1 Tax=Rubus argutus TaxID=59490 RepID=A0AAW1XK45_RUBAR